MEVVLVCAGVDARGLKASDPGSDWRAAARLGMPQRRDLRLALGVVPHLLIPKQTSEGSEQAEPIKRQGDEKL